MTPYNPATIDMIRTAAESGKRRGEIRDELQWDNGMLDRVCARHHIVFVNSSEAAPKLNLTDEQRHQLDSVPKRPISPVNVTTLISALARERLEAAAIAENSNASRYVASLLRHAAASGYSGYRPYRGDHRCDYVTVQMSKEEKMALAEAANRVGMVSMSEFVAAIIDKHLVSDGVVQFLREASDG